MTFRIYLRESSKCQPLFRGFRRNVGHTAKIEKKIHRKEHAHVHLTQSRPQNWRAFALYMHKYKTHTVARHHQLKSSSLWIARSNATHRHVVNCFSDQITSTMKHYTTWELRVCAVPTAKYITHTHSTQSNIHRNLFHFVSETLENGVCVRSLWMFSTDGDGQI